MVPLFSHVTDWCFSFETTGRPKLGTMAPTVLSDRTEVALMVVRRCAMTSAEPWCANWSKAACQLVVRF